MTDLGTDHRLVKFAIDMNQRGTANTLDKIFRFQETARGWRNKLCS